MSDAPETQPTLVEFICMTAAHVEMGRAVPDGLGTLTTEAGRWAYCTAGLHNVSHGWKKTAGVLFDAIRHADPDRLVAS